jgi:hypothetical protein
MATTTVFYPDLRRAKQVCANDERGLYSLEHDASAQQTACGKTPDAGDITRRTLPAATTHPNATREYGGDGSWWLSRFQARSDRSLLCRGPSLLMSRSRWAPERCLFPFAEWPLAIVADIQGELSYTIGDLMIDRRTDGLEQL